MDDESVELEVWEFLDRHLTSIFSKDWPTYEATTSSELGLYEHFVAPHRIDGLAFHQFMIEHSWATRDATDWRYDLLERRLQLHGDVAIASYTLMLTMANADGIRHRSHNETRVIARENGEWRVVHVHKSPAGTRG